MSKHNGRHNVCEETTRRKRDRVMEGEREREAGGERGEVAGPAVPFRGEN